MLIIELTLNPMSTPLINNPDKARVTVGVVYTLVSRGDSSQKALRAVALFRYSGNVGCRSLSARCAGYLFADITSYMVSI